MAESPDIFRSGVALLWTALWVVWLISAFIAKRSVQRQSAGSRLLQSILVIAAFALLFNHRMWPNWLPRRFLPQSDAALLRLGLALTAVGIGFAIWARLWIGKNWSGTITIKEQHELIQTGPYALVRHPIYSGLLLAFLGTAIVYGELRGLVGLPLIGLGFGLKMHMEEAFMVQQFGSIYVDYKHRVKALIPFVV